MRGFTRLISLLFVVSAGAPVLPAAVDRLPDASDIRKTAAEVDAAYGDFMRQSMEIRLGYLYGGAFSGDDHRRRMDALAAAASANLESIRTRQEQIRSAIEAYEGPAWDALYGQTGLWRRVYEDCQKSRLLQCRIDLYGTMAADDARRTRMARDVLARLEKAEDDPGVHLLRAEALWLMGGRAQQTQAEQITHAILARDDLGEPLRCRAVLLRLRLAGRIAASDFRRVTQAVDGGPCADDFELNVQTAFLELRLNRPERGALLAGAAAKWPQARDVMGRAILTWLTVQQAAGKLDADTIRRRTPIEITLALKAVHDGTGIVPVNHGQDAHATTSQAPQYRQVLQQICAVKEFASPLALFVYAEACRDAEPATAVRAYVQAAMAHQQSPDPNLEPGAVEIAHRAAQLAYKLYYEDNRYLEGARLAMGYYCRTAGPDVDEQLQYLYSKLLSEAGPADEWRALCEAIAAKGGSFSPDARLDLVAAQLKEHPDNANVQTAAEKLEQLIASLDDTDPHRQQVKREATALYCKLLLERNADGDVQKALKILERTPTGQEWVLPVLKAAALDKAGRTDEAVAVLADAAAALTCDAAAAVYPILVQAVDRIEVYQSRPDFAVFADRCRRLAAFCANCADTPARGRVELLRAEISLCSADPPQDALAGIEKLLSDPPGDHRADPERLRCRARLLTAQGRHNDAFAAWAELRGLLEQTAAADLARPWAWWQAKYYELLCFLRSEEGNHPKVAHAVDVLQGTFSPIPPLWAQKLAALKKSHP